MVVISAFPGVGKSYIYNKDMGIRVADSDSSTFPKDKFPENYMDHIKNLSDVDIALISSHKVVRKALVENNIPYFLVYPGNELKAEYMKRYEDRDSPAPFLKLMDAEFDNFVYDCKKQGNCVHIQLEAGQYLIDVLPRILLIAMTGGWTYSSSGKRFTEEEVVGLLTLMSAHLTMLDNPVTLGASENATPMIDIQQDFMKQHGLKASPTFHWPLVK